MFGARDLATLLYIDPQTRRSTIEIDMLRLFRPTFAPRISPFRANFIRSLFIQTASTPNEDALKFLPSQDVLGQGAGTVEYLTGRDAFTSPLARKLFGVDGVKGVMFGPDFITVEKEPEDNWAILKPEIFSLLTEYLSSGEPVIVEGGQQPSDTAAHEDDTEAVSMIKELIDTRIRPAIQEDGGDVQYMGFTPEGVVQLKLQGACRSCDSSAVTLKNGIESMLMHYVEEVTGVEQVLDENEKIGLQEFKKLEAKLQQKDKEDDISPSL